MKIEYPNCMHIQPMDGLTYKEALLATFAVIQDLEKGMEKPMEKIESGFYDYQLLKNTSVQVQFKKRTIRVSVFKTKK